MDDNRLTSILIILVLLAGSGVLFALWYFERLSFRGSIPAISGIEAVGSIVLSALLVVLYYRVSRIQARQVSIQDQQAEIMKRQEELMGANHRPVIEYDQTKIQVTEDEISIPFSNFGNGIAKNLQVRCEIQINSSEKDVDLRPASQPLQREYTSSGQSMSARSSSNSTPEPKRAIYPDKTNIRFNGGVQVIAPTDEDERVISSMPFQTAIMMLSNWGIDEISFYLYLEYEDIADRGFEEQILGRTSVDIDEEMTFEIALERGHPSALAGEITIEAPSTTQLVKSYLENIKRRLF